MGGGDGALGGGGVGLDLWGVGSSVGGGAFISVSISVSSTGGSLQVPLQKVLQKAVQIELDSKEHRARLSSP